jgi:hypothetical protein
MLLGVQQLALQRLERATQYVRLGGVQLVGQALEPLPIGAVEVDLHRLPDAAGPVIMIS